MNRFREIYFAVWATVFPVASFLVIPSIQGTTPSIILALASVIWVPFLTREKSLLYLKLVGGFVGAWLVITGLGQLGLYLFQNPQIPQVLTTDYLDATMLLRHSIATQSAYLIACFLTFAFFVVSYRSEWRRYLFWGAWVLAIYGIYEWFFFLIFHHPGDFVANRTFVGGEMPGSWSQILTVGNFQLLRMKSTTGEPSFLALAGMPYLVLAIESRKWALAAALTVCLVLTLSTTAYLALIILGVFSFFYLKLWTRRYGLWIIGGAVGAIVIAFAVPNFVETVFTQKLAGEGPSGNLRQHIFLLAVEYWRRLRFFNKIFGIGFGSAFVTPWLGGLLVNTGLAGVGVYLAGFVWPLLRLPNLPENWALKGMLLTVFFMLSVSVADFTYLTTWMTLGLAYRRLRQTNENLSAPPRSGRSKRGSRERKRGVPSVFQAGPPISRRGALPC